MTSIKTSAWEATHRPDPLRRHCFGSSRTPSQTGKMIAWLASIDPVSIFLKGFFERNVHQTIILSSQSVYRELFLHPTHMHLILIQFPVKKMAVNVIGYSSRQHGAFLPAQGYLFCPARKKSVLFPCNKSFIDQACSVRMAVLALFFIFWVFIWTSTRSCSRKGYE